MYGDKRSWVKINTVEIFHHITLLLFNIRSDGVVHVFFCMYVVRFIVSAHTEYDNGKSEQ